MQPSLRVGVAGLGTVGVAVLQLLEKQAAALAARTGRAMSTRQLLLQNFAGFREVAHVVYRENPLIYFELLL